MTVIVQKYRVNWQEKGDLKKFLKKFEKNANFLLPNQTGCVMIGFVEAVKKKTLKKIKSGSVVKRLRHRPFTAVTRVRFPSESFKIKYGAIAKW